VTQPSPQSRFAIYTRQSVDTLQDVTSCETQFELCMATARAHGEHLANWVGVRFDDQGWSGATLDRPAMRRLRNAIRKGEVQAVYAVAMDRLSRRMLDTVMILDELEFARVQLRLVHQPEFAVGAEGRLLRHILGSFAQFEHELIVGRLAETRTYLKKHGRRLAGPPPYGYDADTTTKQLVPNKKEARRVRAIFARAAAGELPSEIARMADRRGWTTKQRLSKRSGRMVGGGRWTARQVVEVLRNPVYTGGFADKGKVRPGVHPAIIEADVFVAAQMLLDARRKSAKKRRTAIKFPLRGLIVCPGCRWPMGTYVVTHKKPPHSMVIYRYYRCRSTAGGRRPCRGRQYPAYAVEAFVSDLLTQTPTWLQLLPGDASVDQIPLAESLAAIWAGLDPLEPGRLLPRIIEKVVFTKANRVLSITFSPTVFDAINAFKTGTSEDDR
jgi:site-specific DNA recombinase